MFRPALIVFSTLCMVAVLAALGAGGYLWFKGLMTPDTWKDVKTAVFGEDEATRAESEHGFQPQPSTRELMNERIKGFLELASRESELAALKDNLTSEADQLLANQSAFEKKRQGFQLELKALNESTKATSIEQARGVLTAMQPADAMQQLMQLDEQESIKILSGMPEKTIAKILKEFQTGDQTQADRARMLFQAISRGGEKKDLIDQERGEVDEKQ
ncbi:MAG: hypothetical protein O3A00_08895 [Planctomycetota bacterium]|nr:hypothetical protein [Planctomycetota bacterium]